MASFEIALGLDIEVIDPQRDIMALAAQGFAPTQVARLAAMQGNERLREFYAMWCEHEARIKLGNQDGCVDYLGHPELAVALCRAGAMVELNPANIYLIDSPWFQ